MTGAVAPGTPAPNPDRKALASTGALVRARLEADPGAWRLPTDKAEVYAVRDFLDAGECARMIGVIDAAARPSALLTHAGELPEYRTSYSGDVDRTDPFIRMIERRIDDLVGLTGGEGETLQGQRYEPGQEFKAHCDWFWTLGDYWADEAKRGGQRSWTTLIFLNEVEEGGATEFPKLGLSIPPQPGVLLTWNNALPDGDINWDTLHAGTPVVKGVKHVVTKWYRTRKWG